MSVASNPDRSSRPKGTRRPAGVVAGINEVTKALEKDTLSLVLVCRSVRPALLTEHLLLLANRTRTKVCALYDFGPLLGRLVGIQNTAAVGFKRVDTTTEPSAGSGSRGAEHVRKFVDSIRPKCIDVVVPWSPSGRISGPSVLRQGARACRHAHLRCHSAPRPLRLIQYGAFAPGSHCIALACCLFQDVATFIAPAVHKLSFATKSKKKKRKLKGGAVGK